MTISRRRVLTGALVAPAIVASTRLGSSAPAQTLKISHQFPGGTIDEGDFRLSDERAELVKILNNGRARILSQFIAHEDGGAVFAVRKGILDLSLYPIS